MLRTAQSQKKPESQKKSPKRLRRRPALWLRDLLPRSYSVAQHQALYRAARGLREDGTIATWPSGESSNRQLVIARPGFKVRIPTASGYLGRVLVNTASASPQKADDSCAIPQKTTSLLFTQNLLHGLHNRQFDASGRPKEQSVRELGRSYNVSPNTISRVR